MYAPGLGHFRDDHNPDFVLYNKDGKDRTDLWLMYIEKLSDTLKLTFEKAHWDTLKQIVKQNLKGAKPENYFNEAATITGLRGTLNGPNGDVTAVWAPYQPPVEKLSARDGWWERHVLQRSCQDVLAIYHPPGTAQLDCTKVWDIYKKTAIPEFTKRGIPPICPAD
jgi:hypothetical protein